MLLYFADETSVSGRDGRQYGLSIYGGLVVNEDTFQELTNFVYDLKERRYLLPQQLELKWRFETVWDEMRRLEYVRPDVTRRSHPELYESLKSDYNDIKEAILDKVAASDARIVVAIRPNELLNATPEQNIEYSISAVARKFEKILRRERNSKGILLADELQRRLSDSDVMDYEYILRLCCYGSGSTQFNNLVSIVPTINSHVSPIHQINDILLGAMQYYMLEFMRKLNDDTWDMSSAVRLFSKFAPNFYRSIDNTHVINSGILLYPPKNTRRQSEAGRFLNKLENQLEIDFNIR